MMSDKYTEWYICVKLKNTERYIYEYKKASGPVGCRGTAGCAQLMGTRGPGEPVGVPEPTTEVKTGIAESRGDEGKKASGEVGRKISEARTCLVLRAAALHDIQHS